MQFPNGTQKISTTVADRIANDICVRPNAFLIKFLCIAKTANITVTKRKLDTMF